MGSDRPDLALEPQLRDAAPAPSRREEDAGDASARPSRPRSSGSRLTLSDVARETGFSTATVERALNRRPGVRIRTREIVVDAARRLGYVSDGSSFAGPRAESAPVRLEFILPEESNMFMRALHGQLEAQAALREHVEVRVTAIEGFSPDRLAQALAKVPGAAQGAGIIALDHPTVREAIRAVSEAGVKVVTLASDILHVPRIAYVGIDNRAAGRLAGYLLGRFLGASERRKVALFAGSLSYRGHEEREMGFRHIVREEFPNLEIVELREVRDDAETAYAEATQLLTRHQDLAGIYNIGAGNEGIARALDIAASPTRPVYVAHELTAHTRARLLDGTLDAVIDQNPRVEAREALNILSHSIRNLPYEYHPPRLQVIFRENIPET
jgi:LacI family transcriptional regulator